MAGAHTIMLESFSPEEVIKVLSSKEDKYSCSVFMAVPSMYAKIMDRAEKMDLDFSHMRLWTSGSAPLLAKDFEKLKRIFGQAPVEREGMSETGMNFSNPLHGKRKPGSVGLPLPNLEVKILDPETLADVNPGQTGEIWLKGPSVTAGYWQKPEETARSFENGWFKTGDLGFVDEDGYYYLTDRIKHIIISGGENISPKEIELVINRVAEVVESCVVGIPDGEWGEKAVAAVVIKPGSSIEPDDIIHFCKEHLHNWKCPKKIIFVQELPKNRMGKVQKEAVKNIFR
jgi:malonyl-CoA/methylmalonyl-CoA synthetase